MSYYTIQESVLCFTNDRRNIYLYNLLIGHPSKEDILFILVRMESDNVRNFPVTESFDTLACFRIP